MASKIMLRSLWSLVNLSLARLEIYKPQAMLAEMNDRNLLKSSQPFPCRKSSDRAAIAMA